MIRVTAPRLIATNPALVIRDYLTDAEYGLQRIDLGDQRHGFPAAANICDENVSLADGGTEKNTFNGVVDCANAEKTLEQPADVLRRHIDYSNGKWSLKAGAYVTPTVTLDEDDLAGPLQIETAISRRDAYNAVKGQFVSPESSYQATPIIRL